MTNRTRRSFVTTVAATGTLGLAGCVSSVRELRPGDNEPSPVQSPSETDDAESESVDLPDLPGESIADFEDLDGWQSMIDAGELEATTDDPYAGSQSAHLTAGEETEFAAIYRTIADEIDLSEKSLSLAVSFTGREQLQLTLELFAPNSRHVHTVRRTLTGPADRWVRVDFGTSEIAGQPDLVDVQEIRLTARRRGDLTGSIDCRIDDLRAVDRPETGRVLFLFDGTLESHYTNALDRMDEYGYAGVEAVIPEAVGNGGRLTLAELGELDDAGWDLAARPRTGAQFLHEFGPDAQEEMIRRTKTFLENRGFGDGAKHFVTPRNVLGPNSIDLVRKYHEQAFRFGGGPNGAPLTDPHNVGFFSGTAGEETKRYVDYAAEHGQIAVLHFEHIGEDGMRERAFADVLEHVDDADVEVVTATDLLEGA